MQTPRPCDLSENSKEPEDWEVNISVSHKGAACDSPALTSIIERYKKEIQEAIAMDNHGNISISDGK